jgi:hypothetical protein
MGRGKDGPGRFDRRPQGNSVDHSSSERGDISPWQLAEVRNVSTFSRVTAPSELTQPELTQRNRGADLCVTAGIGQSPRLIRDLRARGDPALGRSKSPLEVSRGSGSLRELLPRQSVRVRTFRSSCKQSMQELR